MKCRTCDSLEGQSAETGPTEQMRPETHYFVKDGVVDVYKCQKCGSRWERFVADKECGTQSGSWKTLKPAGQG